MSDVIPEELCYEILLRFPANSLFRFKCVCTKWAAIINDPVFMKKHIRHHHQQECVDHVLIRNKAGKIYSLSLSSICSTETTSITLTGVKNLVRLGEPKIKRLPVPSNSGTVLITKESGGEQSNEWKLWNLFTRESFTLPSHNHLTNGVNLSGKIPRSGIGYDITTSDFKVVRIIRLQNTPMLETLIYSLKSNSWKKIINFHGCELPWGGVNGVFCNGALHWVSATSPHSKRCILAFDISTEEDRVMPFPSITLLIRGFYDSQLRVLGGCLCLEDPQALWIMKNYGENVWSRLVSFNEVPYMGEPVAYFKNKGHLIFQRDQNIVLFDVEKKYARKFTFKDFPIFTLQVIPPSLFRLNITDGAYGGSGGDGCFASKMFMRRKRKIKRLNVELELSDVHHPSDSKN